MSKLTGELSYKDWCILKHALRDKVRSKEMTIDLVDLEQQKIKKKVYEKIKKELAEEKATLERVTKLATNFKRYISESERHYMHKSVDCD